MVYLYTQASKNSILVRVINIKNEGTEEYTEKFITSFYIENISEFIKTLNLLKENDIPLSINEYDEGIYAGEDFFIESYQFNIPTKESIMCLTVYTN